MIRRHAQFVVRVQQQPLANIAISRAGCLTFLGRFHRFFLAQTPRLDQSRADQFADCVIHRMGILDIQHQR